MATHRLGIVGWHTTIKGSGRIYVPTLDTLVTNDLADLHVIAFKDCDGVAKDVVVGAFKVPENYVGTAKIIIGWSSSTTTGNAVWDFDYRAIGGNDTESLDPSTWQESVSVTDAAPGSAHNKLETEVSLTSGNLAAEDLVIFQFGLDGLDASHTFTGVAYLTSLEFEYSDT